MLDDHREDRLRRRRLRERKRNDVLDGFTCRKLLQVPFQDINGLVRFTVSGETNGDSECLSK